MVIGGGPAGLSAAITSARAGADTILVEKFGCFGGVITTVGIETLAWYRSEGTKDTKGIGVEMEKLAEKMGATLSGLIITVSALMLTFLRSWPTIL